MSTKQQYDIDSINWYGKLITLISNIVSIILIPLLIPAYLIIIIFIYFPQLSISPFIDFRLYMITGVLLFTILLPFVFLFIIFKLKIISTLDLSKREDRIYPQVFSGICYLFFTVCLIYKLGATNIFSLVMIANTLSILAITVITNFWKISTHTSGAMGFFSICLILYFKYPSDDFFIPMMLITILTFAVCFARLYLKAHTFTQVIAGCLLGTSIGIGVFYFFS